MTGFEIAPFGLAALLLVAGCGSGRSSSGGSTDAYTAGLAAARAETIASISSGSALEQEILSDLLVTRAEADRAAADVIECASEQGLTVTAAWDPVNRGIDFTTRGSAAKDSASNEVRVLEAESFDQCWRDRYLAVGEMLALQNALSPAQSSALEKAMIICLGDKGIAISSWPADVDTNNGDALQIEAACYDSAIADIN